MNLPSKRRLEKAFLLLLTLCILMPLCVTYILPFPFLPEEGIARPEVFRAGGGPCVAFPKRRGSILMGFSSLVKNISLCVRERETSRDTELDWNEDVNFYQ